MTDEGETLLTLRCSLRRLREADVDLFVKLWTDEEVRRYLGGALTPEKAQQRFRRALENAGEEWWVAERNDDGKGIGIVVTGAHVEECDARELSYLFAKDVWGKGYGRECVGAVLEDCTRRSSGAPVVAETQLANERSCALLRHLGMVPDEEVVRHGEPQRVFRTRRDTMTAAEADGVSEQPEGVSGS